MSNQVTYILNPLGSPLATSLTSNMLGTLNDRFECVKGVVKKIQNSSAFLCNSRVNYSFSLLQHMYRQLLAKLYLLIVSLNKSLKRNKLESQCRYHKCIIEQKQTKVTNLLVDSDVKTSKQNSVTNFKIVKQCYGLHGLSKCITAGKATDKQLWKENLSSRLVEHQHIRKPIFVMRF